MHVHQGSLAIVRLDVRHQHHIEMPCRCREYRMSIDYVISFKNGTPDRIRTDT